MLVLITACGGSTSNLPEAPALPEGSTVPSGRFDTYQTAHNGFSRVRLDRTRPGDAAVLSGFENGDPTNPAEYRNLIALAEADYAGRMTVEVIAQVAAGDGGAPTRLLRLTADQAPFENIRDGALIAASGQYFFKGESFTWVTIDDGPLLSGHHDQGLENLMLDFDRGTANIDIRTEVSDRSQVEIGLQAHDLPFNVVSGAYGGATTIQVRNPDVTETYRIDGYLRGSVGGSPVYHDSQHGMTTSGLYTATGTDEGRAVTVDGVFVGRDPNAAR